MLSNKIALGLISLVTLAGAAAGAGAYLASRHPVETARATAAPSVAPSTTPASPGGAVEATEAVMDDKDAAKPETAAPPPPAPAPQAPPVPQPDPEPTRTETVAHSAATHPAPAAKAHHADPAPVKPAASQNASAQPSVPAPVPPVDTRSAQSQSPAPAQAPPPPSRSAESDTTRNDRAPADTNGASQASDPQLLEVTVPADSVIGLQFETAISSETARVEDRVVARVTRDVHANGRIAIPAGSKVIGAVSVVDRGGRMKEQARLGVRFHTVVLVDGTELPLQTETIYREGESPTQASAAKVGGGAIGGAILGAILGGGKGAAIGGAIGAAGGSAAVMAGGRKPAQFAAGSPVTVKVLSPVTVTVERE